MSGVLGTIFGGGPSKAVQSAANTAENVVSQSVLPQSQALLDTTSPVFQNYLNELEGLTSADPSMRMEANEPLIAQQTDLAQGERAQAANQPRSGATAYEDSLIDQQTATSIGDALSKTFTTALTAEGQAGEWGIGTALTSELSGADVYLSAGGVLQGAANSAAQGAQSTEQMIASLAMLAAGA
jgi:hypothetical protein